MEKESCSHHLSLICLIFSAKADLLRVKALCYLILLMRRMKVLCSAQLFLFAYIQRKSETEGVKGGGFFSKSIYNEETTPNC